MRTAARRFFFPLRLGSTLAATASASCAATGAHEHGLVWSDRHGAQPARLKRIEAVYDSDVLGLTATIPEGATATVDLDSGDLQIATHAGSMSLTPRPIPAVMSTLERAVGELEDLGRRRHDIRPIKFLEHGVRDTPLGRAAFRLSRNARPDGGTGSVEVLLLPLCAGRRSALVMRVFWDSEGESMSSTWLSSFRVLVEHPPYCL